MERCDSRLVLQTITGVKFQLHEMFVYLGRMTDNLPTSYTEKNKLKHKQIDWNKKIKKKRQIGLKGFW